MDVLKKLQVVLASKTEGEFYKRLDFGGNRILDSKPFLYPLLHPPYEEIFELRRECWVGNRHRRWEPEFSMLQDTIRICEEYNLSFDFMVFRLLYANGIATKTLDGEKIIKYIQNIYMPNRCAYSRFWR
jgi:hypothetical protein